VAPNIGCGTHCGIRTRQARRCLAGRGRLVDGLLAGAACVEALREVSAASSRPLGDPMTVIYNAGSGLWGDIESITLEEFEASWRVNAYGALAVSREVIPAMKAAGSGSLIFIGATASRRGGPNTAAFAPAKAAQRSLAESMARSLWPCGIHVALIVIDAVVDLPRTRRNMPDKPDGFFLKPDDMAASAVWLAQQPPSAWSFEIEVRPLGEKW
jgi:NAD(P)-dependent dehydrogenase (short-subunit alcohol dehydrogenase family)